MRAGSQILAEILQPCSLEDFLATIWGQTYKYVPGPPDKFSRLLPWERLNEILRQHRLDFPRLRLTRDGERLPTHTYLSYTKGGQRKVSIPRVRHADITRELRRGASLVLDAVDELHQPLTELAEGLELFFHERIQINCYSGWRTSRGFDLHWDDHDVFILQVTGPKSWQVYGPTRLYPLTGDKKDNKPEGDPLWEGTLTAGDLLYIPRGFWHVAFPLNEPTLHLTVGVHNRTGLDLARWAVERLRASETFRRDLPLFATDAERAAHVAQLREELLAEFDSDVFDRYFRERDANALARGSLSLPWSPSENVLPDSPGTKLRLLSPRPLDLQVEKGVIEFCSQRKRWRFAAEAFAILQKLETGRVCSIGELCEATKGKIPDEKVRVFLQELVLNGLAAIVSD